MKPDFTSPETTTPATLQTVLDRVAANDTLSESRRRDLRCAITRVAKLRGDKPGAISLDLAEIRQTLDNTMPARAHVSGKRWHNLRSDFAAAIASSGLRPMLKTADVELNRRWADLLAPAKRRIRLGLSRFARWASLHRIAPEDVDHETLDRFIAELDAASLIRNLDEVRPTLVRAWNGLAALHCAAGLHPLVAPASKAARNKLPWRHVPALLQEDLEHYLAWTAVPDPLAEGARPRRLAPLTQQTRRTHVHSAVSAAATSGIPLDQITSLTSLVEAATFRAILTQLWRAQGGKLSAYSHGVAVTLLAIASEWVKVSPDVLAALKSLTRKLGRLPSGLTEKNKRLLRSFDDSRLTADLIELPDKLWNTARRRLGKSRWAFNDLQTALAIDLLLHVPMRLQNLVSLNYTEHLHWPQGPRRPAILTLRHTETKNEVALEFEIPSALAERLRVYRNEIAPGVIGERPESVFVNLVAKPRNADAFAAAIQKAVARHLGVKMSTHQFRHLAAKIILDANPGAYELVRQLLGHKNHNTTTNFYAGIDTRRAGRAHAELLQKLRETRLQRGRHRRLPLPGGK
jgi:hypothetical protein